MNKTIIKEIIKNVFKILILAFIVFLYVLSLRSSHIVLKPYGIDFLIVILFLLPIGYVVKKISGRKYWYPSFILIILMIPIIMLSSLILVYKLLS